MLFLAVLGGAAVLEVHRALNGGNKDVREIKRHEAELKRQLQVCTHVFPPAGLGRKSCRRTATRALSVNLSMQELQKELQKTKEQRELTEKEAAMLSELTGRLQQDKAELEKQSSTLRAVRCRLTFQVSSTMFQPLFRKLYSENDIYLIALRLQENEELSKQTSSLLERQAYLEECEESLKQENANLLQQVRSTKRQAPDR